jgi:hypothetical protein
MTTFHGISSPCPSSLSDKSCPRTKDKACPRIKDKACSRVKAAWITATISEGPESKNFLATRLRDSSCKTNDAIRHARPCTVPTRADGDDATE